MHFHYNHYTFLWIKNRLRSFVSKNIALTIRVTISGTCMMSTIRIRRKSPRFFCMFEYKKDNIIRFINSIISINFWISVMIILYLKGCYIYVLISWYIGVLTIIPNCICTLITIWWLHTKHACCQNHTHYNYSQNDSNQLNRMCVIIQIAGLRPHYANTFIQNLLM